MCVCVCVRVCVRVCVCVCVCVCVLHLIFGTVLGGESFSLLRSPALVAQRLVMGCSLATCDICMLLYVDDIYEEDDTCR